MSRPKPTVLLNYIGTKSYKAEQILKADAIYAVFFDDEPINLRTLHTLIDDPSPKYKKVSFPNPGHAFNLAEKLNKLFKTDRFSVHMLTSGKKITEHGV